MKRYRSEVRQIVYRQKASWLNVKTSWKKWNEDRCHGTLKRSSWRRFKKVSQNSEEKRTDTKWMKKRKETCFVHHDFQKCTTEQIREKKSPKQWWKRKLLKWVRATILFKRFSKSQERFNKAAHWMKMIEHIYILALSKEKKKNKTEWAWSLFQ